MIQLFQYPHDTLLQTSTAWTKDDSIQGYDDIEKFEYDYVKLMLDERGMGLAANQVGITKRFFAIGHESFDTFNKHAIIWNPSIKNFSQEKVVDVEGCLSFKGIWLKDSKTRWHGIQVFPA
jgi:peptide deformylase